MTYFFVSKFGPDNRAHVINVFVLSLLHQCFVIVQNLHKLITAGKEDLRLKRKYPLNIMATQTRMLLRLQAGNKLAKQHQNQHVFSFVPSPQELLVKLPETFPTLAKNTALWRTRTRSCGEKFELEGAAELVCLGSLRALLP